MRPRAPRRLSVHCTLTTWHDETGGAYRSEPERAGGPVGRYAETSHPVTVPRRLPPLGQQPALGADRLAACDADGGDLSATLVMAATGRAGGRWQAAGLAAFAILAGLLADLVVCFGSLATPAAGPLSCSTLD